VSKNQNQSNCSNQSQEEQKNKMNQSKIEANVRENASEQVTIGFGFTSDWLRKWRELF